MNNKYSIDTNSEALIFIGKPKILKKNSLKDADKNKFTSVIIPNSIVNIEEDAFLNCTSLVSVHIPSSVSTIDAQAFGYCWAIASIHIPNSIETVKPWAFDECLALASVHIPNSVSTIGAWAFYGCSRLHTACLPANSKNISLGFPSSFAPQTSIIRPRLAPIPSLQKKSVCRASKAAYSIYL